MITIDYLVCTWAMSDLAEAQLIRIKARTAEGQKQYRLGFIGRAVDGLFFGENPYTERFMVHATGSMADVVARMLPEQLDEIISVARLDIACTTVTDDADAEVLALKARPGYKLLLYRNLTERGATMYVGSPSSRARIRVYNKSAEANISSQEGKEYIRYELQLRNQYADRAWKAYRKQELAKHYLAVTMRMLDQSVYKRLSDAINDEASELDPIFGNVEDGDWIARRLAWLETCVVPATAKLIAARPDLADRVKELLDRIPRHVL